MGTDDKFPASKLARANGPLDGPALPFLRHQAFLDAEPRSQNMAAEFHGDVVRIEQIEVLAHIGVPDDERSQPQRLTVSVSFWPARPVAELNDNIGNAVNYAEVCDEVRRFVQSRRDRLIETLADALANRLLEAYAMERVTIELRKYVLPDVKFVSITVTRERAHN